MAQTFQWNWKMQPESWLPGASNFLVFCWKHYWDSTQDHNFSHLILPHLNDTTFPGRWAARYADSGSCRIYWTQPHARGNTHSHTRYRTFTSMHLRASCLHFLDILANVRYLSWLILTRWYDRAEHIGMVYCVFAFVFTWSRTFWYRKLQVHRRHQAPIAHRRQPWAT